MHLTSMSIRERGERDDKIAARGPSKVRERPEKSYREIGDLCAHTCASVEQVRVGGASTIWQGGVSVENRKQDANRNYRVVRTGPKPTD